MDVKEWLPVIATLVGAAYWVVRLMITNQSLQDKVERLEEENNHLRDYAKVSKP